MNTGVQRSGATPPARSNRDDRGGRTRAGQRVRPGQGPAPSRDGARHPLRRHRDGRRPARSRGQGRTRDGDSTAPATSTSSSRVPLGWGSASKRHDQGRPTREGDRALPGLRGRATARSPRCRRSDAAPRSRRTCRSNAAMPPVRRARTSRPRGAHPGDRRSEHRDLRTPRPRTPMLEPSTGAEYVKQAPVRDHARGRFEPCQPHRLVARRATRLRRPDAAVQRCLPRRGERPALALRRRAGRLRGGLAPARRGQSVSRP